MNDKTFYHQRLHDCAAALYAVFFFQTMSTKFYGYKSINSIRRIASLELNFSFSEYFHFSFHINAENQKLELSTPVSPVHNFLNNIQEIKYCRHIGQNLISYFYSVLSTKSTILEKSLLLSLVYTNLNCKLSGASRYFILLLASDVADLSAQGRRSTTIE